MSTFSPIVKFFSPPMVYFLNFIALYCTDLGNKKPYTFHFDPFASISILI